jgi:hypothetical protein
MSQTATTPKSAAECEQIWTTADANKDGKLDAAEMETSKSMMPSAMQSGSAAGTTGAEQSATNSDASASNSTAQNSGETTGSMTKPGVAATPASDMTKEAFAAACATG